MKADTADLLPTVAIGGHSISRLIVGGNPVSGNSHLSAEVDHEMESYFTTENTKRMLFRCEECGINTMQLRADRHIFRLLREYRSEGGSMMWIAQTVPETAPFETNIIQIAKNNPIAIYHHGSVTDSLFKSGNLDELTRRLAIIRKTGKPTGLCTHMPAVIRHAEENHWDVDFYMASVHNLSRIDRVSSAVTGKANEGEPFFDEDRAVMYETIRSVSKPCLAFKILGAGRKCQSSASVRNAFEEAFEGIKPSDAVIVGMFPKEKDQVGENAGIVRQILTRPR